MAHDPSPTSMTLSPFGFRTDVRMTDWISRAGRFTLSAEIIPPRNGGEVAKILGQVERLIASGAEFLSVTKGAGGSLRGGSLPIAQLIKERFGVPCIAHFTCRDLTPEEVENLLMDHHYFGVRNILALRGDPPDGQKDWKPREGGYHFAHELITQIRRLNEGRYLARAGTDRPEPTAGDRVQTDFCIGAAAYPEHPHPDQRIEFFRKKVEAGAEFAITDMLFDADAWARFRDDCSHAGLAIPILPGTRVLTSQAQARRMMAKFRVSVPAEVLAGLPESEGSTEAGAEAFVRLAEKLRSLGAPGIHAFVISDTESACLALSRLRMRTRS